MGFNCIFIGVGVGVLGGGGGGWRGAGKDIGIILYSMLTQHVEGKCDRQQMSDIFLIFPRKWDLTFHLTCLVKRQF